MTNAEKRYAFIHQALKAATGGKTLEELQDHIHLSFENEGIRKTISIRMLQKDIDKMISNFYAPIEKLREDRKWYFYYADNSYNLKLDKMEASQEEKNQLLEALKLLEQFNILNPSETLYENVLKINANLSNEEPVVLYATNPFLRGIDHLKTIYNAIRTQKKLEIKYQAFDRPIEEITLDPFVLKEYNQRWYAVGWNDNEHVINKLPLDRIVGVKVSKFTSIPPHKLNFNAEEHFYDVIGITVLAGLEPIKIQLTLTRLQALYTQNKPLHGSQSKMLLEQKKGVCTIKVIPNYELLTTLWSLGDGLLKVEPSIEEIKKMIS